MNVEDELENLDQIVYKCESLGPIAGEDNERDIQPFLKS